MKKSLREILVGTWKLVEFSLIEPNGQKKYPLGSDAKGFIMYTPDGYMSAQLMKVDRPVYASKDWFVGTQEEMALAAQGYMAYSGPFEVDEENSIIIHHMDVSMNPSWLGQGQVRKVKVDGNRIYITTTFNTATVVWERCEDISKAPFSGAK